MSGGIKFTPTYTRVQKVGRSNDQVMKEELEGKKSLEAIFEFQNMEQKDWIDRKEAQARAIKLG